ncbi:ribosome maturation factor RimP [Companilactobacillus sp. RD055328]|uniref:ribosome maturation factor RimP n=1 Tax=Companilactobacillus sp. RD055328 TaxID=2916634 RepID=UPI001FC817CC|nr:ribosome maturation factor RimP [Companilactobacillus sp. RD055328]GKQ42611.1 ribosome maturation factor RimP [Companilactobacillus sp. RD055328]
MDNITQKIEELLLPILKEKDFYLVDLEFVKEGADYYLRAYIDKDGGIDIDECVYVSEKLSEILDVDDPIEQAYILEVSSPGAERPLKSDEDLKNAIGEYIHVSLYQKVEGAKIYEGHLTEFNDEKLELDYKVKNIKKHITLPRDIVASTRLAIEF